MIQIATALQTNNTLKDLEYLYNEITDNSTVTIISYKKPLHGILGIRMVICTTRKCTKAIIYAVDWRECQEEQTKNTRALMQQIPPSYAGTVEKAKEWLQCVEVGGKNLIQSQEDSQLQTLHLEIHLICLGESDITLYLKQVRQALEATAATVNTARQEKGLPHIEFTHTSFNNNKYVT